MARVRTYATYDEAVTEWRRNGIPEEFIDRKRLFGRTIVFRDDLNSTDAENLVKLIRAAGEDAFVCRKAKVLRVMVTCKPSFFDRVSVDEGELGKLGRPMAEAFRNYHSDYVQPLRLRKRELRFDRTLVMGVLNVTPDSFSDGGLHRSVEEAVDHGMAMADQGADIIDIGGESTRPGAAQTSVEKELSRVIPVIKGIAPSVKIPLSIDTRHAEVARKAIELGVEIVNDVSGLRGAEMIDVLKETGAAAIVMHMRGEPDDMQSNTTYDDIVGDIGEFLVSRVKAAEDAGIDPSRIAIDPGIGFGKDLNGNLDLIRRLREFRSYGRPILVGASRKGFIGKVIGGDPEERLTGSLVAATAAIMNGANIVRAHDVLETVKMARMADAIRSPNYKV
ncbi:MAG: dihydropteroate synthase [Methanomassiliicoccales archaeon]|jgi:dihydropteroate synthase